MLKYLKKYGIEVIQKRGRGSENILIKPDIPGANKSLVSESLDLGLYWQGTHGAEHERQKHVKRSDTSPVPPSIDTIPVFLFNAVSGPQSILQSELVSKILLEKRKDFNF